MNISRCSLPQIRCLYIPLSFLMITIYTHSTNPTTTEFWKWTLRRLIRKYSGPNAVEDSLLRGLKKLQIPFVRNQKNNSADVVLVLSGPQALRGAIALKKNRRIKKLIAGPNVVTHPKEFEELICDQSIDTVLVPSEWVKDFWVNEAPSLSDKLVVWPAGVEITTASTRTGKPIIYDKLGDKLLLSEIQKQIGRPARVFTYGNFKRKDYLKALTDASFLVYISKSESQGLALQEAWAHDVPTLVNKSTFWSNGKFSWEAAQINCPYLTEETGEIFESASELPTLIKKIVSLSPKTHCDKYLSDRASAQKFLDIL